MLGYIKQHKKNVIVFILSIFLVYSINISLDMNVWLIDSFRGNDIFCIIQLILYIVILDKVIQIKDKRLSTVAITISVLFALFQVFGYTINNYSELFQTIFSNHYLIKLFIKFVGFVILFYSIIALIYIYINNYLEKRKRVINDKKDIQNKVDIKKKNIKTMLIYFVIIFIAYIPYLLQYYPGILSFDSASEIGEATGVQTLTNQHPLLHIFFVLIPMTIGGWLGDYNIGVMLFSIMQMLVMSFVFAFTLLYMKNKGVPKAFVVLALIFFAIYPVNALFSITVWKDVMFALAILLLTICIIELLTNTECFIKSKSRNALFVLSILAVMLLRHNGFYVGILLIPFLFMIDKKYYKRLLVIAGITLVTIFAYRFIVLDIVKIQKGNSVETISVLVQQVARTVKYEGNELTLEDKQNISKFFNIEEVGNLYDPYISDPVKGKFNHSYYDENKGEFFSMWFNLFLKHPIQFIEAFMYNNYGYWYPETWNFILIKGFSSPEHSTLVELDINSTPIIDSVIVQKLADLIEERNIPLISFMFSVGFIFWILILCLGYNIYQKKTKNILIFIPCLLVWLTILASPVFCEYRYIYSLFVCMPIFLSTIYLNDNVSENLQKCDKLTK